MVTTRVKISTMDHFAKASSHNKIDPLFLTETLSGGANQSTIVIICFVYGQKNENKKIRTASSLPPAERKKEANNDVR